MRASARRWFLPGAVGLFGAAMGCAPHGPRADGASADETTGEVALPAAAPVCDQREDAALEPVSLAEARAEGERDAALELARGVLALESYGRPRRCHAELAARLRVEYGIEYRSVGACALTNAIVGHALGYNETMHRYIDQRHGAAVEAAARRAGCFTEPPRRGRP